MDELDKKLDEILDYMGSAYYPGHEYPDSYEPQNVELRKEALPQVKQAFIDAGWVERINDGFEKGHKAGYHVAELEYQAVGYVGVDLKPGMMTGPEWYAKFEKELKAFNEYDPFYHDRILPVAKKAAGIE